MADAIKIQLEHNAAEIVRQVGAFPAAMQAGIAHALDRTNEETIGQILAQKLSRRGPKTLGVVSNRLRLSIRRTDAIATVTEVDSAIGSNVKYAGIHEFGFTGSVQVREHRAQHRALDIFKVKGGRLVQGFELTGALSETGGKRAERVALGFVTVRAHQMKMNMPERAYIRSTIGEQSPAYARAVSSAIVAAWGGTS